VYAVTSHFVTSHTRELGIRVALGAPRRRILGTAVGRTVRLGIAGGVLGLAGALALSRLLRATLYETSPLEAGAYVATVVMLVATLLVASYVPVRRALRVDPVEVLRAE
jgi:putative ABC transport system permease protein